MRKTDIFGQLLRAAALFVAAGLVSLAALPALEDSAIAIILGCLVFVIVAPLLLDHSPAPQSRNRWKKNG